MRNTTSILWVAALAAPLAAQGSNYTGPANLVFAMDNTVEINSINTTNQAHIVGDEAIFTYAPQGPRAFALPYCDYGTWNAFLGDEDGDGDFDESIITSIDAVHVPPGAPCPPSMFDVWISIQTPTDGAGYIGAPISDGDIFRFTPTGIETFISQAQIIDAAASTSTNVDVTGFTIDNGGDLYFTFSATVDINGTPLLDGGIIRIPATGYTLTGGVVSSVVTGSAEIVMDDAEVNAVFLAAGYDGVSDLSGIQIDPTGGTFVSSSTSLTVPHLWLSDDDTSDEGLASTVGGGVVPTVNGVAMQGAAAFGLRGGFSGGALGSPFGIGFQFQDPTGSGPLHLDEFPLSQATPTIYDFDVSGATSGGFVIYAFNFGDVATSGGFTPRAPAPIPLSAASWGTLYGGFPVAFTTGTFADAEGFASLQLDLPINIGTFGLVAQAGDLASLTLSSPLIAVID